MSTTAADPWAEDEAPASSTPPGEPAGADAPTAPPEAEKTPEKPANGGKPEGAEPAKTAAPAIKKAAAAKPAPPPKKAKLGANLAEQKTVVTVLYWGPEGTGKTTSALRMTKLCGPNQRVLFVDAEAGAKIQALRQRGVDVSKVEVWPPPDEGGPAAITFESMYDLAEQLTSRRDEYVGWIWDSGGEITRRLLDQVVGDARVKDERLGKQRGRFQVNLEDHGVASAMLRELLRKYRDLGLHGAITALERRDQDNDTGKVKYGPAMSPAMANDAAGLVDVVLDMSVDEVGGEVVRSGISVPTKIRRAKDRFGVLPKKLADPYFDRLVAYVDGDLTRENDPVQAHVRELATAAAAPAAGTEKKEN